MSEPQEKILAFDNQFNEFGTQIVQGAECISTPFPFITPTDNLVSLKLTQEELRELLSSIQVGAEWTYPDKSHQILFNFMRGLICPPEMTADAACTAYSPTSAFVHYSPNNPDDKKTPDGYLWPAWVRFGSFDTIFPDWIDNWVQGQIEAFTGYQANDVLCNIGSFPANTVQAFLSSGGVFPSFEVHVSGQGTIELELLSFPLGGRCCIKLDSAPNIVDLLTGGILDSATLYVDTNRDLFSFPPEENVASTIKINVETLGDHILYVVFVPVIDDAVEFIGLGGGIRSIELCGFEEVGEVGIESIVWDACELKYVSGGVETVVATAAEIQACLDLPAPSGVSGNGLIDQINNSHAVPTQLANATTTYADVDGTNIKEDIVLSESAKVYAAFYFPQVSKSASGSGTFRLVANALDGGDEFIVQNAVTVAQGLWVLGQWRLDAGSYTIKPQFKSSNTNEVRVPALFEVSWTIGLFGDVEAAFVQDIRIFNGELQKKIGNVWYDVVDSFASIIAAIQATAQAASTTANNALNQANSAYSLATTANNKASNAQAVNVTQNTRLNAIEAADDLLEGRVTVIETLDIPSLDARLDALEALGAQGSKWGSQSLGSIADSQFGLSTANGGYTSLSNSFGSLYGLSGWVSASGYIAVNKNDMMRYSSVQFIRVVIHVANINDGDFQCRANSGDWCNMTAYGVGSDAFVGWIKLDNWIFDSGGIEIQAIGTTQAFVLTDLDYLITQPAPFA